MEQVRVIIEFVLFKFLDLGYKLLKFLFYFVGVFLFYATPGYYFISEERSNWDPIIGTFYLIWAFSLYGATISTFFITFYQYLKDRVQKNKNNNKFKKLYGK